MRKTAVSRAEIMISKFYQQKYPYRRANTPLLWTFRSCLNMEILPLQAPRGRSEKHALRGKGENGYKSHYNADLCLIF